MSRSRSPGRLVGLLAAAASLAVARSARADEQPLVPAEVEIARASAILDEAAKDGRDRRLASLVVGLSTTVALVPIGTTLLVRSDDVAHTIGASLLAGAGGSLFIGVLALPTSKSERLRASFEQQRASGVPNVELLRRTESTWQAAAESSASRRALWGTIETAFGGALLVGGSVLLLASPIGGLSQTRQYNLGATLMGSGVPFLSFGIHSLFVRTPEETSWAAYRAGKAHAAPETRVDLRLGTIGTGPALLATGIF